MMRGLIELRDAAREDLAGVVDAAVSRALPGAVAGKRPPPRARLTARGRAILVGAIGLCIVGGWSLAAKRSAVMVTARVDGAAVLPLEPIIAETSVRSIAFSDGARVALEPGAEVRLVALDAHGGRIRLTRGSLAASFRHHDDTRWFVEAGDVEIAVTGTRFVVRWEPDTSSFALTMDEGSVRLSGCKLDGRAARAGEVVEVSCRTAPASPPAVSGESADAPATGAPPPPSKPGAKETGPAHDGVSSEWGVSSGEARPVDPPWRRALREGRADDAFAAARQDDFADACENATLSELSSIVDAARHARALGEARLALTTLRRRFPSTAAATRAAFDVGVLDLDRGQADESSRWFERYLEEQPNGALAREALGRLVEARSLTGDRVGAREAAQTYLSRHAQGPHAALARRMLAE